MANSLLIVENPFPKPPRIPKRFGWSYSTQKLFRKCKRKFFWTKLFRLRSRREAAPLVISSAGHEGLELWYRFPKVRMSKVAARIVKETKARIEGNSRFYNQDDYDNLMILLDTVTGMLMGYASNYASDRKKWKINRKTGVEAWFDINMGPFDYRGKIDLLPIIDGKQRVLDHKIISKLDGAFIEALPMDGQLRSYLLGTRRGLNLNPKQVTYNMIKKCKLRRKSSESLKDFSDRIQLDYMNRPEFYFHRETLTFTKAEIANFVYSLETTNAEYEWLLSRMDDPLDPQEWPEADHNCGEFFKTCEFFPLCNECLDRGTGQLYSQYNPEDKKHATKKKKGKGKVVKKGSKGKGQKKK